MALLALFDPSYRVGSIKPRNARKRSKLFKLRELGPPSQQLSVRARPRRPSLHATFGRICLVIFNVSFFTNGNSRDLHGIADHVSWALLAFGATWHGI